MRFTKLGKAVILILTIGVAIGIWKLTHLETSEAELINEPTKVSFNRPLRVGIVSWPGYAGGIVANNGFKPNKDCIFWDKHNLQVEFLLMEDIDIRAKAFQAGGEKGVDIVWSTVDFWANESVGFIKNGLKVKAIMQVDWSQGGDAIVADRSISQIEDLRDKKISLALFTPSHWLLESNLQNSSLDEADQARIVKRIVGKNASPDARADFVAGKVDAAVVWEPDVTEALQKRPNSHILVSTRTANNLIADIMVAREDFIKAHPDVIKAFVQGWLEGTVEANRNPGNAAKLLAENEPLYKDMGEQATLDQLSSVKWADLMDNTKMFGLDGSQPLFDDIFEKASSAWLKRGYIDQKVSPQEAKDDSFLKQIYAASPVKAPPDPQVPKAPPGKEEEKPIETKQVNIFFAIGSATLDDKARQVLDQDVSLLARTNANAYIRIEGNTDNVGDSQANKVLSMQRAQAVIGYLVDRYKLNPDRFIPKGNGPDNPKADNYTEAGRAKNRRTDVMILPVGDK
jgi:NitT/TauT family transport system substrate-binding protein